MGLSLLVGCVAGIVAMVFTFCLDGTTEFVGKYIFHHSPESFGGELELALMLSNMPLSHRWLIFFIPAIGGLLAGFLIFKYAPSAEGHGTDAVIHAFHRERGRIPLAVPLVKLVASVLTIGTGGSAGREGPIALIGAGFASFMSSKVKLSERETRILVICGVAAGIGAIFRAPLGGAIFAVSVLYSEAEFEYEALMPSFISSIMAYSVFCTLHPQGWGAVFNIPEDIIFHNARELPIYACVALILAAVGPIYVKTFWKMRDNFFMKLPVPKYFIPAIGGLMLGVLCFFFPAALGGGYEWLQMTIDGAPEISIRFLLMLALVKIIATSFTISSGGSGGVFAPSLVIGGSLGGAAGLIAQHFFPNVVSHPGAYVLVGMAGFFTGVAKVPIAALIMVSEMTLGYSLLVPLMLVCAVTYFLLGPGITIYREQVGTRLDSPAHMGDFVIDILEQMKVEKIVNTSKEVVTIPANSSLQQVLNRTTETTQSCFPVVSENDEMIGMISYADIRPYLYEPDLGILVIAGEIAVPVVPLVLSDSLDVALRKIIEMEVDEMPVVSSEGETKIIALLSRRDIIAAYHKEMLKHARLHKIRKVT